MNVFSLLDKRIDELSKANGLSPAQVKLLQPLHQCVIVGDSDIFVVLSSHDLGGVSTERFVDWSGKAMNIPTAVFLAERDLGFKDAFAFHFSRSVLNLIQMLIRKPQLLKSPSDVLMRRSQT